MKILKLIIIAAIMVTIAMVGIWIIDNKGGSDVFSTWIEEYASVLSEEENLEEEEEIIIIEDKRIEGKYEHNLYQEQVEEISKQYGAVGVSVALIEKGKVIDTFTYGSAVKGEKEMTADTKIRIASISKVFVGIATMISVEEGTMTLDEDIGTYWGFKIGTRASGDIITPRALLTHTSSLYDSENVSTMYYSAMASRLKSGSGIRNIVSGNIENYYYNNYAIDVLGTTIELANNKTIDEILQERIYSKLNIDAAFYGGDVKDTANIATLYRADGTIGKAASTIKNWHSGKPGAIGWGFAGGVTISVNDLGQIVALLQNNGMYEDTRYLSEESIDNLEYHEGNETEEDYWQCQPLFYETNKCEQEELYYHTGSGYGVYSLIGYNPVTEQGIAVITTGANDKKIYWDIAELLLNIEI